MKHTFDEQMHEMLTYLVTQVSNALERADSLPPMALSLDPAGTVATIVGASGEREALKETLQAMKKTLAAQAEDGAIVACCLSYADFGDQCIVAFVENDQNECTEVRIPVLNDGKALSLDLDNITIADGGVFVFPMVDDESAD